jgi:YgiT-type zinc finger domain-containing protein
LEETTTEPIDPEKCDACGGRARLDTVNLAIWTKKGLVVVEGVQAYVCQDCSEQTYDDNTATELRKLASADFPREQAVRDMQVPVYRLPQSNGGKPN